MCGLFGWLLFDAAMDPERVGWSRLALRTLAHRGPDSEGEWIGPNLYMGHRRLRILDLTDAADQPFHEADGGHVFTFNGEIYNYVELGEELAATGVSFRTRSDTEVMLAALVRYGLPGLRRLDGMFAAALHDRATGRHSLMRDPLGQKPLYYHVGEAGVVYASELRALLSLPGFSWRLDRGAFHRYLMSGYYAWDETPVVGIRKLLPGCALVIEGRRTRLERYWDSRPGEETLRLSETEAVSEFQRLFDHSCRISMRTDVPYGVFLSGGIDSSLVLESCMRQTGGLTRSFCVAMGESDYDESGKAELVSRHLGVRQAFTFRMDQEAIGASLARFMGSNDEPHGDPGFVNASFLAQSCRPHVTVALAGDGGDELFAGYAPFAGLVGERWLTPMPRPLLQLMKAATALIPANDRYLGLQFKLRSYLQGFPATPATRFALWLATLPPERLARLCPGDQARAWGEGDVSGLFAYVERLMAPLAGGSGVQRLQYYYQKVFLPEFVAMHTDRAAMQVSLEVRAPFLSVPLIEFANRLPDGYKLRGGSLKWLLKEAARQRGLPEAIINQKKQGFTFPLARWLKGALRPEMEALLAPERDRDGLVEAREVARLKEEHLRGEANHYRILYHLMVFRRWREEFPGVESTGV
ncbi:MAG: asparagine synthase (glutamine-hydrolyzing) [Magnetococcales bacterium]|nr:asparagine synthase (glutamine-hydrolyzing) [Magnetococcales bacterium]